VTVPISEEQLYSALAQASRAGVLASISRELAHDLKSPIQALYLFDFEDTGPEMEQAFRSIVEKMAATIEKVARIYLVRPAGKTGIPFTIPELIDVVREISEVQRSLPKAGVTFVVPAGLPAIDGNVTECQHALINLIMNAREAAGGNAEARVTVTARAVAGGAEIEVRDNGPGIPPERRESIFEPFTTTREAGGVRGLGLPVARWLARKNNGGLRLVAAEPGQTCFVLSLRELGRG